MRKIIYFLLITMMCIACGEKQKFDQYYSENDFWKQRDSCLKQDSLRTKEMETFWRQQAIYDSMLMNSDISVYLNYMDSLYPTDPKEYAYWDSITADGIYFVRVDFANRELDTIVDHIRYVCRTYGVDGGKIIRRQGH